MNSFNHHMNENSRGNEHGYTIEVANEALLFAPVNVADMTPTGRQLALAAGLRRVDEAVVLQMLSDGQLEDIRPDEVINLETTSRRFIVVESDRTYNLSVDGIRISWPCRIISGGQLRKLGSVPPDQVLYQDMTSEADRMLAPTDLVDLDGAGVERFSSRSAVWLLNVQGVTIQSQSPTISVRDALEKAHFDVTQGWQIILKVANKPKQSVDLATVIDLREPGIEKLRLTPKEVNNGEPSIPVRHDFSLLDADEDYLTGLSLRWSTVVDNGRRWLILEAYPVPLGYTVNTTKLALEIPPTYPGAQIDMFYVYPPLALASSREIPSTQVRAMIEGVEFHGWSRHRGPGSEWKIGVDNVITHMALVESALQKEVE